MKAIQYELADLLQTALSKVQKDKVTIFEVEDIITLIDRAVGYAEHWHNDMRCTHVSLGGSRCSLPKTHKGRHM